MKKSFVIILFALCAFASARAEVKTEEQDVACGSTVKITATAKEGYRFIKWSDDVTDSERTFANVQEAKELTAYFAKVYIISISALEGGKVSAKDVSTPLTNMEMLEGDQIEVTATADDCWEFLEWSDGVKSPTRTITASAELKELNITAKFQIKKFNFKISSEDDSKGTVSISAVTE